MDERNTQNGEDAKIKTEISFYGNRLRCYCTIVQFVIKIIMYRCEVNKKRIVNFKLVIQDSATVEVSTLSPPVD